MPSTSSSSSTLFDFCHLFWRVLGMLSMVALLSLFFGIASFFLQPVTLANNHPKIQISMQAFHEIDHFMHQQGRPLTLLTLINATPQAVVKPNRQGYCVGSIEYRTYTDAQASKVTSHEQDVVVSIKSMENPQCLSY